MPTLNSSEEPDSYNMDYYYSKYRDRYGIGINENNPSSLKVLPPSFNPESCDIQGTKKQHYFQVPEQPTIGTCYCKKYHTSFTSQYYRINHPTKIGQPSTQTTTSISVPIQNCYFQAFKQTKLLLQLLLTLNTTIHVIFVKSKIFHV